MAAPTAGQPCDPVVPGAGLDGEGAPLHCAGSGGGASWTQVPPQPLTGDSQKNMPENDTSVPTQVIGSGHGTSGNGNANANGNGNGNTNGNGNGNANGKGKPVK